MTSYCLRDNVLYKRNNDQSKETFFLVVPSALRMEILQACHDEPTAWHLGVTRTFAGIYKKYYWPRLIESVQQYVRTCRDCQRRKTPLLKPAGLLHPVDYPDSTFRQNGMGLLDPFQT